MTDDGDFGQRFLAKLQQLGVSVSPLHFSQLQEIKAANREGTIRVLRSSGGSLSYRTLQAFRSLEPEELAQRIPVLSAGFFVAINSLVFHAPGPETSPTPSDELAETRRFGERLLSSFKARGVAVPSRSYREMQELKVADREAAIRLLAPSGGSLSYSAIQAFKTLEPDEIARQVATSVAAGSPLHLALATLGTSAVCDVDSQGEATYGQRFLNAMKGMTGSSAGFNYANLQKIKAADREELIVILRQEGVSWTYAALQQIREMEPEALAQRVLVAQKQAQQNLTMGLLITLAFS